RRLRRRPTQLRPLTANTRHHTSGRNLSGTRQPSLRVHTQYLLPSLQLRQLVVNLSVYLINGQNGLIVCFVQRSLSLRGQIFCIQRFEKLEVRSDLGKTLLSGRDESVIFLYGSNLLRRKYFMSSRPAWFRGLIAAHNCISYTARKTHNSVSYICISTVVGRV